MVTEEDICPDNHTLPGFEPAAPQTWGEPAVIFISLRRDEICEIRAL